MTASVSIQTLPFSSLCRIPGLVAFATTRVGGVSQPPFQSLNLGLHVGDDPQAVMANRRSLWQSLGFAAEQAVCLQQVHGSTVRKVCKSHAGSGWSDYARSLPDCDGVVTSQAGLMLAIGTADCLAILLADSRLRAVGAAHAGWRGGLANIAAKLVAEMQADFGSRPEDLVAALSPCLGPCCLELGSAEYESFARSFPGRTAEFASPLVEGHFKLDLWKLCAMQLQGAGLPGANIEAMHRCTGCQPEAFFSHRRDKQRTGRMWNVIGFKA